SAPEIGWQLCASTRLEHAEAGERAPSIEAEEERSARTKSSRASALERVGNGARRPFARFMTSRMCGAGWQSLHDSGRACPITRCGVSRGNGIGATRG